MPRLPLLSQVLAPFELTDMKAGTGGGPRALTCLIGHSVGTWDPCWMGMLDPMEGLRRASIV